MMQRRMLNPLLNVRAVRGVRSWLPGLYPRSAVPTSFTRQMTTTDGSDPQKEIKWKWFEKFSCQEHEKRFPTHETWLSRDVPEEHLLKMGYCNETNPLDERRRDRRRFKAEGFNYVDDGVDIFVLDTVNKTYHAVQCKNYDKGNSITYGSLNGFYLNVMGLGTKGYVYATSNLSRNLERKFGFGHNKDKLDFYLVDPRDFAAHLKKSGIEIEELRREKLIPTIKSTPINELSLELYPPQQEAIKALLANSGNGRQVLSMPCGIGKTVVAAHVLNTMRPDVIICVAPMKISVDNLRRRLSPCLEDYEELLVDSDEGGELDSSAIQEFLHPTDKKKIIFTTMISFEKKVAPLFVDNPDALSSAFLLVDEVHNAISGRKKPLRKAIDMFPHSLLMSATIPVELYDQLREGPAYTYSISEAIRDGYVCDYQVNLPWLDPNSAEIDAVVDNDKSYDRVLVQKAMYLANGMLQKGSRRCVVYLRDCEEEKLFGEAFRKVCEYQGLTPWISHIDGHVKQDERRKRLEDFQQGDHNGDYDVFVLLSVRVLDEAVDMPRCDSVFITHIGDGENDIRTVQRMMRGGRKDPTNKFKTNHLFIWTEDYNSALDALSLLKSTDIDLHKKVGYVSVTYGGQERPEIQEKVAAKVVEMVEFVKTKVRSMSYEEWWDLRYRALREYCKKYEKLPPKNSVKEFDFEGQKLNLGSFVDRLKQRHRGNVEPPLSEGEKSKLGGIGPWTAWVAKTIKVGSMPLEQWWDLRYRAMREYSENNGKLPTLDLVYDFEGHQVNLGSFVNRLKERYRGTKDPPLSVEEKSKLGEIGPWTAWTVGKLSDDDKRK